MLRSIVVALLVCCSPQSALTQYLTAPQVLGRPSRPADARLSYGSDPLQFGDLRLPKRSGPHPVVVIIHGGCWTTIAGLQYLDEFADALTSAGWATWNVEFRRVGETGGGWPGTFLDVGQGTDFLREIASSHHLDLTRVVLAGHSSGGHLALWAAGRRNIAASSAIRGSDPLVVRGAINLGGVGDLRAFHEGTDRACATDIVTKLMGGAPDAVADRYRQASPAELLPLGVPQLLMTGVDDVSVPPAYAMRYAATAKARGDRVELSLMPAAGHFEVIAPWTRAWPRIEQRILEFLEQVTIGRMESGSSLRPPGTSRPRP